VRAGARLLLGPGNRRVALRGRTPGGARPTAGVPFSTQPSAWIVHAGTLWMGLAGYNSEGEALRGGLVAVGAGGAAVRYVTHRWLDDATVTGIAVDTGGLWVGTKRPGEYGDYGGPGLVRYQPARALGGAGRWTRVTAASGALADDLVQAVGAGDGVVAVASDAGLAVRGADGRWARRYWRLALAGDTIAHELSAAGPEDATGPRALRFLAVQALHVPNPGAFLAALERADLTATVTGYGDAADMPTVLATPALAAPLAEAVRLGAATVDPAVLAAVGRLAARADRPPAITAAALGPPLRALLAGRTPHDDRAVEAAVTLAHLGDAAAGRWLRAAIASEPAEQVLAGDVRAVAAAAAARAGDAASIPLVVALLGRDIFPDGVGGSNGSGPAPLSYDTGTALLLALTAHGTAEAWQAATAAVRARPVLRAAYLSAATREADSLLARTPALRDAVVRETIAGLAEGGDAQRAALGTAMTVARHARVVDALVRQLQRGLPAEQFRTAAATLVHLTGRADAPYLGYADVPPDRARQAAVYWSRWAAGRAPDFTPVAAAVGDTAVDRWTARGSAPQPAAGGPRRGSGDR
jgi:hypothetical protein